MIYCVPYLRSAQKLNVLVDALVAASFDSHLLQVCMTALLPLPAIYILYPQLTLLTTARSKRAS
jgi:hypothetical protein